MWRRFYLLLLATRVYFALSPSYIHPDEHFQGPEVIAGDIFGWQVTRTWEFTSEKPIRSILPLWAAYGLPMQLLHLITGDATPNPVTTYYMLRILFFLVSFVLEDWAIQELVTTPRRRAALLLVGSSYVTWTYQTHTFSNSVETIAVVWAVALIQRISKSNDSALFASALLGCVIIFGIFNRITFVGFIFLPILRLVPHFVNRPLAFIVISLLASFTAFVGIYMDTIFYNFSTPPNGSPSFFSFDISTKVITPLNNLLYNSNTENLARHGLHPRYTHFVVNLPLLLGPASISALISPNFTLPMLSAISGTFMLSLFKHQEARFLLPCVPLILSSIRLPKVRFAKSLWIALWIVFNIVLGTLMGVLHQGGIVPAQNFIAENLENATTVIWWKTYSPPTWLLGEMNERCETLDLMGAERSALLDKLETEKGTCGWQSDANTPSSPVGNLKETYLVAPVSKHVTDPAYSAVGYRLEKVWEYKNHLSFDDLDFDFNKDGYIGSVKKIFVDERGLGIWRVVDAQSPECAR
ncbi:Alg9-like mannosyltransferase family-domain-containing protein [Kalaharituber pfeilii]|nr:Alg9-like mannosyltransferase family-domain-containing protein [Kalaharituber pfeilii]